MRNADPLVTPGGSDARAAPSSSWEPEGALASARIRTLIEEGFIRSSAPGGLAPGQVQPASLDLTLSAEAWRMPGSVLPLRTEPVRDLIRRFARRRIDLASPEILDRDKVVLVRLNERLHLPAAVGAYTNSKSSTGRIDLQTRTITDRNPRYEKIRRGYDGELFLEIIPKSFDVELREGDSLNQIILYGRRRLLLSAELAALMETDPLLFDAEGVPVAAADCVVEDGLLMSVDLSREIVGWVARKTPEPVRIASGSGSHDAREFFDPIPRPRDGRLVLCRGSFYILSTAEHLRVPADFAVEMLPYESTAGEFRAHYAGFFDPGFGAGPGLRGTPAVLEVRAHDDDLILRHGQPICKMVFEHLSERPAVLYGEGGTNHYQHQRGPRLSRLFRGD